ncbi:unnamed protein product [Ectocarpus sp. 8 AP-2014]
MPCCSSFFSTCSFSPTSLGFVEAAGRTRSTICSAPTLALAPPSLSLPPLPRSSSWDLFVAALALAVAPPPTSTTPLHARRRRAAALRTSGPHTSDLERRLRRLAVPRP